MNCVSVFCAVWTVQKISQMSEGSEGGRFSKRYSFSCHRDISNKRLIGEGSEGTSVSEAYQFLQIVTALFLESQQLAIICVFDSRSRILCLTCRTVIGSISIQLNRGIIMKKNSDLLEACSLSYLLPLILPPTTAFARFEHFSASRKLLNEKEKRNDQSVYLKLFSSRIYFFLGIFIENVEYKIYRRGNLALVVELVCLFLKRNYLCQK